METNRSLFDDLQQQQTQEAQEQSGDDHDDNQDDEERAEPVAAGPRVGRNDLCPCGSGKKYKKCCQVEGQPSA